jgi:hypothetical protein
MHGGEDEVVELIEEHMHLTDDESAHIIVICIR